MAKLLYSYTDSDCWLGQYFGGQHWEGKLVLPCVLFMILSMYMYIQWKKTNNVIVLKRIINHIEPGAFQNSVIFHYLTNNIYIYKS